MALVSTFFQMFIVLGMYNFVAIFKITDSQYPFEMVGLIYLHAIICIFLEVFHNFGIAFGFCDAASSFVAETKDCRIGSDLY